MAEVTFSTEVGISAHSFRPMRRKGATMTVNAGRRVLLGALGAAAVTGSHGTARAGDPSGSREPSVSDLQVAMARGTLTAVQLARRYLARIEQFDRHGPHLRSVLEVNPD